MGTHTVGCPFCIGIPSAPGKVPKYVSNERFSCMMMITCLMTLEAVTGTGLAVGGVIGWGVDEVTTVDVAALVNTTSWVARGPAGPAGPASVQASSMSVAPTMLAADFLFGKRRPLWVWCARAAASGAPADSAPGF